MVGLTERQHAILEFVRESIASRGYPPTHREIGAAFGIRSTNGVNDHLLALERKGFLSRDGMRSRAIRVLRPDRVLEARPVYDPPIAPAPEGYRLFGRLPGRRIRASVAA